MCYATEEYSNLFKKSFEAAYDIAVDISGWICSDTLIEGLVKDDDLTRSDATWGFITLCGIGFLNTGIDVSTKYCLWHQSLIKEIYNTINVITSKQSDRYSCVQL